MNYTLLKGVHLSEIPCIYPDLPFADEEMLKAFEAAKPKLRGVRFTPLITGTAGETKCMHENCLLTSDWLRNLEKQWYAEQFCNIIKDYKNEKHSRK